jgi:hypothetical protein
MDKTSNDSIVFLIGSSLLRRVWMSKVDFTYPCSTSDKPANSEPLSAAMDLNNLGKCGLPLEKCFQVSYITIINDESKFTI